MSEPWYEFDIDHESLEECRDRRLRQCPYLTEIELEALKQLLITTWDGCLISKNARGSLLRKGLIIKWNGWQVVSREGLAVLETLTNDLNGQCIPQAKSQR